MEYLQPKYISYCSYRMAMYRGAIRWQNGICIQKNGLKVPNKCQSEAASDPANSAGGKEKRQVLLKIQITQTCGAAYARMLTWGS